MNEPRIQKLFKAARQAEPVAPPPDFARRVQAALPCPAEPSSLLDQLGLLFPQLAATAALVILLGLGAELSMSLLAPGLAPEDAPDATEALLFSMN